MVYYGLRTYVITAFLLAYSKHNRKRKPIKVEYALSWFETMHKAYSNFDWLTLTVSQSQFDYAL